MTRRSMLGIGTVAVLLPLGSAALVAAGPAAAQPCGSAVVFGNGGGRCDSPPGPDGSFTRCDTVYVLGIGGTNCYQVPPGTPRT